MKYGEIIHIFVAFVILVAIIIAPKMFGNASPTIPKALLFAFIILLVSVSSKKIFAFLLESNVEHKIWTLERWGLHKQDKFKKPLPLGIILPIIISLFSFGAARLMSFLTYETTPKKTRAVRAFGHTKVYSYVSMTDWHNALIGAASTVSVLILALVAYFLPWNIEPLARLATFYAFSNMLPLSKLDGIQIFFGSRVLYVTLAAITLIFTGYAIVLQ